ncbi:uncharacterized protein, partial [Halyomorpha halys]|uniref:uncharacterized protein n=1 Tax=Halyomorpha halys TaxID=286706 RepID=UPI0006D4D39B
MLESKRRCTLKSSMGKKMRKRKELDALLGLNSDENETVMCEGPDRGGTRHQDEHHSELIGEGDNRNTLQPRVKLYCDSQEKKIDTYFVLLKTCTLLLIFTCIIASITVTWLLSDLKQQTASLKRLLEEVSIGHDVILEPMQNANLQLQKNETKIRNDLIRLAPNLSDIHNKISGIQTLLSKVDRKLDDLPWQNEISDAQKKVNTALDGFKTEIMEMQSTTSNMVSQHSKIKKMIKTMTTTITSCN